MENREEQQIKRLHYSKKEQVELMSIYNQAHRYVQLEIELRQNKKYFNEDGTLNFIYLKQRFDEIFRFLLRDFVVREKFYKNSYFEEKNKIKK
ncbi:MAG: hypothetical protein KatS3mg096_720 [Candidatus Parcubacteria bacterium]|nr:MAG: hypothetical protein KatS3mg096_720 [Candidatus Parcubacteria bacterium]